MQVVTGKQMKQIEQNALKYDLTIHRLMENAGSAAAAFIRRSFKISERNCIIFCSKGNNGGDGLVVARKLAEHGVNVLVTLMDGKPSGGESAEMLAQLDLMGVPVLEIAQTGEKIYSWLSQTDLVVDAICGTGFYGELREHHRKICDSINICTAAVVSLDLPTGVECDSGKVAEGAIKADFTLAFDSLKPAHVVPSSLPYCGVIEVLDIGIPAGAREGIAYSPNTIDIGYVFSCIKPREIDSHKGDYGKLINISGSARYRGAAILSTLAALRCGTGLVTLASTEPVCAAAAIRAPEAVFLPLAHNDIGTLDGTLPLSALTECLESATAVLFGCGLENNLHTARLLEHVLKNTRCPLVLDADGINALAGNIHILKEAKAPLLLTPHSGEMARLCEVSVDRVQADRAGIATDFARRHNVAVILKGHKTIIAMPDGEILLNETGGPGLAKGGSGDILAGMIAAFLGQGLPPRDAAACGVFLHGMAGDKAAARLSRAAMLPGDILNDLAQIFLEYKR